MYRQKFRVLKQVLFIVAFATSAISSEVFAASKGISFQAVLKRPDGTYPTVSGVSVTLQILDPVSDCVLREEVHTGVNISNGYINLVLGAASATTPAGRNPAVVLSIPQALDNSTPRTGLNCVDHDDNIASSGQTYTPTANDARKLRLRSIIGGDTIVADFNMRSVAYAVNAENLEGKTASAFVQTSAATTQANVESVFTRYATLDAILNGTFAGNAATATALAAAPGACPAGQYMSAMTASGAITCGTPGTGSVTNVTSANSYLSVATGTSTPVLTVNVGTVANTVAAGNDARFTDSRAPNGTAGGDLSGTYPNPTVAKVSGKTVTLTSPAAGDLLTYDGTKFVNSPPATAVDATKLPLAGGTMTGAIDMGSQNLTNLGFVTMSANKSLHLSNNASDPSGLVASDKGKVWFNSTSNQVKYWDGSAAQPLGVAGSGLQTFNTQTGSTQTLAIGTSGTAPGWNSASNVHTLNIPMASTAAVTAGLLSKADYDAFTAKLDSSSALAGDVTGTAGTTSVDKIKGKAVTPAAYAAGQTLRYDGTQWVNAVLGFADLGSTPTTLAGYGITDAQSSTLSNGKILVGNASNVATAVTVSGDATLSNAGALTLATVPISKGGTGLTSFASDKLVTTSGAGAVQTSSCGLNQVISFTAGGAITCANISSLVSAFVSGGNSFGGAATLGTNDAYSLSLKTNNTTQMTILSTGNVGIGATTPAEKLEVNGGLKLGTTTATNAGTLRWDGTNFQGYTGSAWTNFVPNPPSSGACDTTMTYSTAGTYAYTVPASFGTITVRLWGGGGAGGNAQSLMSNTSGGASSIASLGLNAGGGLFGASTNGGGSTGYGTGGIASGGTTNTNGTNGDPADTTYSGAGGLSPNGGAGGSKVSGVNSGPDGGAPGGGGAGGAYSGGPARGAGGGGGAYVEKTYTTGTLAPGTYIGDIIVGAGGIHINASTVGGAGGTGRVSITCATAGAAPANDRGIVFMNASAQSTSTNFVYDSSGRVGIGTGTPTASLDVNGAIKSVAVSNSGTTVDFATGNLQYTSASCGAITLNNMKSGATYTLAVQGAAGGTCAFTAYSGSGSGALTVKAGTVSLAQTVGKDVLFTFSVLGSVVYVTGVDGY